MPVRGFQLTLIYTDPNTVGAIQSQGVESLQYKEFGFRPPSAPVEEGKVYECKIEDFGREGDGLARIKNFVIFVPGTKIGDRVKVKITRVLRRMAFGEVVEKVSAGAPAAEQEAPPEETPEEE